MEIELKTFAVDHLSPSKEIIQDPIYLESLVFDYLSYAGIGSNDVELFEHNNVSFLSLTKDACTKLEVIQKHNRSSITIQRFWRGFQTRKSIDLPESTKEKNNKRDLLVLSDAYTHLINLVKDPHIKNKPITPNKEEKLFMQRLNSSHTFTMSKSLADWSVGYPSNPDTDGLNLSLRYYIEYSPVVIEWLGMVFNVDYPKDTNLLDIIWDGTMLCKLSTILFPRIKCQLLTKGPEYSIHKIIFFLEFCRTIGIRANALFSIADLVLGPNIDPTYTGAFTVLRTIITLEKQARKKGWLGPVLNLKRDKLKDTLVSNEHLTVEKLGGDAISMVYDKVTVSEENNGVPLSPLSTRKISETFGAEDVDEDVDENDDDDALSFESNNGHHGEESDAVDQFKSQEEQYSNKDTIEKNSQEKENNDVIIGLFMESEITYLEKLESLQEHVISRFPEYQQLVFEGIYEDTTEMELLLDVIRNLINSHRNFLSRIHMNPKDVTTNFLKLVLELEKSIFLYVVSIKKLGEFFDIEWLQIPLFRLEEYLDSVYVQTNMPASVNRVGFLCEYLSILDFTK